MRDLRRKRCFGRGAQVTGAERDGPRGLRRSQPTGDQLALHRLRIGEHELRACERSVQLCRKRLARLIMKGPRRMAEGQIVHGHDEAATCPPKPFRWNEVGREHHAIAVGGDEQGFERS